MDISTAKGDLEFANEGLYKLIGGVLERYGKRKHNENEEENAPKELDKPVNTQMEQFCGDLSLVANQMNLTREQSLRQDLSTPEMNTSVSHPEIHRQGTRSDPFKA